MRMSFSRSRGLVILLGAGAVAACSDIQSPEQGLNAARAKWTRVGPVSYSMTIHFSCSECGLDERATGPVVVEVQDGRIASRTYARSGNAVVSSGGFPSVEELFTLIDFSIRRDESYEAEYDPSLGYPVRVVTAPGDSDWIYTVTNFKVR